MDQSKRVSDEEIRDVSASITRLKTLTTAMSARLYADIEAAWMSLCLLNDARLVRKLDKQMDIASHQRIAVSDLYGAMQRMEAAAGADEAAILGIIHRIKTFLAAHYPMAQG